MYRGFDLWDAIAQAFANGTPGLSYPITVDSAGVTQETRKPLVKLELPGIVTIPWRVTLAGMRFSKVGNGGAPPLGNAQPADNQVATTPPAVANDPLKVRVLWGNTIEESALIDYPWSGLSFVVVGKMCEVRFDDGTPFPWTAINVWPTVGAFATPCPGHAGGGFDERTGPRFTTRIVSIAQGGSQLFPIPRRAVGYRLFSDKGPQDPAGSGYQASTQQETALGAICALDYDGTFGLGTLMDPSDASRWWPIHPSAELVRVLNTTTVGAPLPQTVGLSFVLDLS